MPRPTAVTLSWRKGGSDTTACLVLGFTYSLWKTHLSPSHKRWWDEWKNPFKSFSAWSTSSIKQKLKLESLLDLNPMDQMSNVYWDVCCRCTVPCCGYKLHIWVPVRCNVPRVVSCCIKGMEIEYGKNIRCDTTIVFFVVFIFRIWKETVKKIENNFQKKEKKLNLKIIFCKCFPPNLTH